MQTMHTIHIRGPQPMFFYFVKIKVFLFLHSYVFTFSRALLCFFHGRKKITGKKNCHSPHPESTFFNMQILHVYEIITGFSQLYFYRYDCFFAAQDGFVKKML